MTQDTNNQTLLKLLTQLIAGGIGALVLVLGGLILHQNTVTSAYEHTFSKEIKGELGLHDLRYEFKVQLQEWKNVLLGGQLEKDREKYWSRFVAIQDSIQAEARILQQQYADFPKRAQALQSFIDSHSSIFATYRRTYEIYLNTGFDAVVADRIVRGIDREPTDILTNLIAEVDKDVDEDVAILKAKADQDAYVYTPLAMTSALLIIFALFWFLRKNITAPLSKLLTGVADFSHGDFTSTVEVHGKGEVLALNQSLNDMQTNMRKMISQLKENTGVLKNTSETFSGNVSLVTQQFDQVQTRADMVATATQEMSAASQEISRNAQNAAEASNAADSSAKEGIRVMTQTIDSINRLSHEVEEVTRVMNALEESTNSIGSVLDVIKGIAEQTNLLALNAAIEAARAGEQGRGFAVVADEVRTLAQRTQESTEEIHRIIETVQNGASSAVSAMRKGRDQTNDCVRLAESAGVSIHEITDAVESIKSMNTQIAAAAEEQTAVSEDISQNITDVATLSSDTQHTIQQNAKLANDLDSMANNLREITAQFRV